MWLTADGERFPNATVRCAVVVLSDGEARAMLLGDIIHCPLELMDDDFDLVVDMDQGDPVA